jgi:putative peptidoglycan lipid II flippase
MGKALRNIGVVSGVTLVSRVLGLGRDMAVTAVFGTTALASAFVTAFTLPNLFRRLLGEGALTAAFVPTLQEETRRNGDAGAFGLVGEVANWTLALTAGITTVAMLFLAGSGSWGPTLIEAGCDAATVGRWVQGAELGVWLFPYMVMVCLAAVFSAALQTRGRFIEPALSPVWLNLCMMGFLGWAVWGRGEGLGRGPAAMHWLCAGVLAGGALQLLVPAAALWRLGWRPCTGLPTSSGVKQIARLMVPTLFGSAIYLINMTVSRLLGLSLDDAAATVLNLSTRLMELPIGVFAIAISTVFFPQIAMHAAAGDMHSLAKDYRQGMRLIILVNVPAAFGLVVLAKPIIRVLFQHGQFNAEATELMIPVLRVSALALPFLAFVSLALRAFYAQKDTETPVRAALASFCVNVAASLVLMRWAGTAGLAMGATLAVLTQAWFLQVRLTGKHTGLGFAHLGPHTLKVLAAGSVMALAVAGAWSGWERIMSQEGKDAVVATVDASSGFGRILALPGWRDVAGLAMSISLGLGVFTVAAWVLRVEGRDELIALIRRKLKRGRGA